MKAWRGSNSTKEPDLARSTSYHSTTHPTTPQNMSKILAVFGATGHQGSSVIDHVLRDAELSQQYKIRAITRDVTSAKAKQLKFQGVDVVYGDVQQRASPLPALAGVHTVFVMTMPAFQPSWLAVEYNQGRSIVDVAVEQGAAYPRASSSAASSPSRTGTRVKSSAPPRVCTP